MANDQKKLQKKKERERENRKKILRRRAKTRAEASEEYRKALEDKKAQAAVNRHTVTVNNKEKRTMTDEEAREQLRHNMQILQALEQEYDGLIKSRQSYIEQQQQEGNFGGSAGVEFTPFNTEEDRLKAEKAQEERQRKEAEENA